MNFSLYISKFFNCCIHFTESAYITLNAYHFVKLKELIKVQKDSVCSSFSDKT